MLKKLRKGTVFLATVILVHGAGACLWDTDTLEAERARFPEVAALITGNFARHSKEFHEWRIKQRKKDIASNESLPEHYHDLAVSQHKMGDHKAAIATMMKLEKLVPGLYETYSNLGTFYIYTGQLDEALKFIKKALAINANAHFGREKYQAWLVEWMMERKAKGGSETSEQTITGYNEVTGFAAYVARKERGGLAIGTGVQLPFTVVQRTAAIRGVKGMMFFADYDNPLLLEALGDLLGAGAIEQNAAQLASMCYMHAAIKTKDEGERRWLKSHCSALMSTVPHSYAEVLPSKLEAGLEKGTAYMEQVRQDELRWIAEGKDAAAEFQKKYLVSK